MSNWTSGNLIANGLKLHYVRTGGDKPPLVMAHGHSDNGLCWTRVAKTLEKDYDLIMYDARGHGLSDDGPGTRSREDMARDAAGLIEALGLEKPGMLGHSMGAGTAAMAAAVYPDLLSYIILEDVPWFDETARARWQRKAPAQPEKKPETREEWVAFCHERSPHWHEDEVQPWADSKVLFSKRDEPPQLPRRPWQEVARKITCPTLLITGDPEMGSIVTAEVAKEALKLMPQGQLAYIEGASHNIRRSQFEAYMEAVQSFLAAQRGS